MTRRMHFAIRLILSGLALAVLAASPARAQEQRPAWRLKVVQAAAVSHEQVTLGDIAVPVGQIDPLDWEQLKAIELFSAPPQAGKPMSISRAGLRAALEYHLKDLVNNLILPEQLVLQYGGKAYLPEELQAMAMEVLKPQIKAMEGEPEIRDWSFPLYVFIADGERLTAETAGAVQPGRVSVRWTVIGASGKADRQFSGGIFLNLWAMVPVAAKAIGPGDGPINAGMVTYARRNLANLRPKMWDGRGGPWRVKSTIGADQVIYADNLETPPMVKKGDEVTVRYDGPNIRITAKAMAMHDAKPDGTIEVQNLQSKKQFAAKVIDAKTVAVISSTN
ncbi:MAG: flagellar basal body P-ring formation protein FlgA [Desulfovibrionaceae bacterium]|nr:flagellar basal body P-ring formation protein FlgA [Desulfovibrionaceae bacterium]MBF0512954.1 flagellar basal body P-ring formation protein FlgA [Desulfovibrionaceae bacterium]